MHLLHHLRIRNRSQVHTDTVVLEVLRVSDT
jgi:hypothetical protein